MISGDKEVTLSDGTKLEADYIVIATGSEPKTLDNQPFHKLYTDEELLQLKDIPDTITIVGAGILGVELAVILQSFGCKVTLAERENRILPNWDEDVSAHMASYLSALGIELQTNADTLSGENGVFCIGRTAKLPEHSSAVSFDAPWLHFVGDATGASFTADLAIAQGEDMGGILTTGQSVSKETLHCQCLYTPLEAAMCGDLPGPGDKVAYLDTGYTASGVLFGTNLGMVKLVLDSQTNILKGCHIVSQMASETIQIAQLAINQKITAEDFV
ncbi:MAG: NAD(P)/FAD-dependent oxidoreductase, partial [Firmicutes bacterium]|nr:NAD(P)/FAD-dependent oxidoreductase [Bacillota bacterium]